MSRKDHVTPNSSLLNRLLSSQTFSNSEFPLLTQLNLLNGWLANGSVVADERTCGRGNCKCEIFGKLHRRNVIKYRIKEAGDWIQKKQHLRPSQVDQAKTELGHLKGIRQLFREFTSIDAFMFASMFHQDELIGLYYASRGSTVDEAEIRAIHKQAKKYLAQK